MYGGPPRSLLGLCRAQRAAGADVEVVTTTADGERELPASVTALGAYEGVPVTYCPRSWPRAIFHARTLGPVLAARLRSADVLHVHGLWNATVWRGCREAARAGVPWVLSPRGMLEPAARAHDSARKRLSYRLFDRRVLAGAALLHATSRAEFETLRRGWPGSRAVCIPNAVEPHRSVPGAAGAVREQFGLPPFAPVVLFLGRLHAMKRLDLLAAAHAAVLARRPDARLVVAGPDEGGRARSAAAFAPLGGSVTWTGGVDDHTRRALLDACATLVLCSDSESFGMSVAEAMAAGRPVVVTQSCPWPEVEAHGAGYWIPQTAPAIADAVLAVLADPAAALAMGERGRALVEREYTWSSAAGRLLVEYRRVVGGAEAEG